MSKKLFPFGVFPLINGTFLTTAIAIFTTLRLILSNYGDKWEWFSKDRILFPSQYTKTLPLARVPTVIKVIWMN
jgi:hypothetical protein